MLRLSVTNMPEMLRSSVTFIIIPFESVEGLENCVHIIRIHFLYHCEQYSLLPPETHLWKSLNSCFYIVCHNPIKYSTN